MCDNVAVTKAAFRELSAGLPPCFAAVPSLSMPCWSQERVDAFRALCANAGGQCHVFDGIPWEDHGERIARLRAWISSLPSRCAVFAANDIPARDIAEAALGVRPPAGHRRREESIPFDNRVEVAVVNQCQPFAHAGAKRQPSHPLHLALFDEFAVHHVVELPLQQDEPQGRILGEGRDGGIGRVFAELPDALLALGGEF